MTDYPQTTTKEEFTAALQIAQKGDRWIYYVGTSEGGHSIKAHAREAHNKGIITMTQRRRADEDGVLEYIAEKL